MSNNLPSKDIVLRPERESPNGSDQVSQALSAGLLGAASALLGAINPVLGVLAGGLAPVVQTKISELIVKRGIRLRTHLDKNGVSLENLEAGPATLTEDKLLLLQEAIEAALGTDKDEKVAVIIKLLKFGLDCDIETDVLAARRFARTVSRLDEVDLRVLLALQSMKQSTGEKPSLVAITVKTRLTNSDLVRSSLSALDAEGLVKAMPGALETWTLSDYGQRLVVELAQAYGTVWSA